METCLKGAILLGLIVQLCYPLQLGYKDCGSSARIRDLAITACKSHPCILHRGQSYSVNVTFTTAESSQGVKTVVHGMFALLSIPLNVPWDSCKSGHLPCPIEDGATLTYSATIEIAKLEPLLGLEAKWEILDDSGRDIVCFIVPLKIEA